MRQLPKKSRILSTRTLSKIKTSSKRNLMRKIRRKLLKMLEKLNNSRQSSFNFSRPSKNLLQANPLKTQSLSQRSSKRMTTAITISTL
jgi:hypothetical protein